jgi:hypothetical protein
MRGKDRGNADEGSFYTGIGNQPEVDITDMHAQVSMREQELKNCVHRIYGGEIVAPVIRIAAGFGGGAD